MNQECRYVHDWDYNMLLFRQMRRRAFMNTLFWLGFLVLMAAMSFYTFQEEGGINVVSIIYGVLALVPVFALIYPNFEVKRAWKKNCAKWDQDRFEMEVHFGDSVHFQDDTGLEGDIPWYKIAELEKSGPLFILRGEEIDKKRKRYKKLDYLFFPASGFPDGTGDAFLEWMKENHPKIPITGNKVKITVTET